VQFQPSGTLPNNLYFDDSKTYRIEIRRGNTSADELIWEINNFQPGVQNDIPDGSVTITSDNQISNPQFAFVSFNNSITITTAGSHEIAPGWFLELVGAGSITVTQIRTIEGQDRIPGNPSYALQIQTTGWTEAYLRQRFAQNGSLWASTSNTDQYGIAVSAMVRSNNNLTPTFSIYYREEGQIPVLIKNDVLNTNYRVIPGAKVIDPSSNGTANPNSYVDMLFTIPVVSSDITISNLQVVGQSVAAGQDPIELSYEQEPVERQQDHLFHYYANSILTQPKESILAGWHFGLNPWQFRSPTQSNVANNTYTADQTILIQQAFVSGAVGNNVSIGRADAANNHALKVTAVTANNQFAILQYVAAQTIRPYWGSKLSAYVKARISTTNGSTVRYKMRLIYRTNAVPTVGQNEPVQSWTASGDPVFSAGWTAVSPLNDPTYTLTSTFTGATFNQFTLQAATTDDNVIGVILYTVDNMTETGTPDSIYIESVSLTANDFGIETTSTYDQEFRKCQFYYEKSYAPDVYEDAASEDGLRVNFNELIINGGNYSIHRRPIFQSFESVKRTAPTMRFYDPTSADPGKLRVVTRNANVIIHNNPIAIGSYTLVSLTTTSFFYNHNDSGQLATGAYNAAFSVTTEYHYAADARLGI
jgi:hypothetical protein